MRPGLDDSTRMRSHISTASSMLCVTIRIDLIGMRPSCHRSSRSVRSVSAVSTSSAENGSSISRMFGLHDQRAGKADALAHAARKLLADRRIRSRPGRSGRSPPARAGALVARHARAPRGRARRSAAPSARETARSSGTPSPRPAPGPSTGWPRSSPSPSVGAIRPGDDPQQRRLARARPAQQADDLAGLAAQIDTSSSTSSASRRGPWERSG